MARTAAKIDANQPMIVKALRAFGATVQTLAAVGKGCPDLLVGYKGKNFLLEVKVPGGSTRRTIEQAGTKDRTPRELYQDQADWHDAWAGQVEVVHTPEYALRIVGAM